MYKKLILKYGLLSLPFVIGSIMFGLGIFNIVSSLLFFCGGYVVIKNMFDYRKVRKNINSVNNEPVKNYQKDYSYRRAENIVGLKRTRRYHKVRKRVKNIDF